MTETEKPKVDEYQAVNRQISDIWASLAQVRADVTELRQMCIDMSDGMYRRKVRPKPPEENEDYLLDKALAAAIEGMRKQ